MNMTKAEERLVLAVFDSLLRQGDRHLNTFLGSETIKGMHSMWSKLRYSDYCERHGIKYEDMTEDDFMDAYEEEDY